MFGNCFVGRARFGDWRCRARFAVRPRTTAAFTTAFTARFATAFAPVLVAVALTATALFIAVGVEAFGANDFFAGRALSALGAFATAFAATFTASLTTAFAALGAFTTTLAAFAVTATTPAAATAFATAIA